MAKIHICNTFFESELEESSQRPLRVWMDSNPIFSQLQFLPLLYAAPDDKILVTALPKNPDPRLTTKMEGFSEIEDWGASISIHQWAKEHHLPYTSPPWEHMRTINSKVFSFTHTPKLPGAALLNNEEELREWIEKTPGPKVLKTPFGTSGKGHTIFLNPVKRIYKFPLIGEPWVKRCLDFSSQWFNQKLLGITRFESSSKGSYRRTYEGPVPKWALDEHLKVAKSLIEKTGYYGHIGVDAFTYLHGKEERIHPVAEINTRKTMSWIALQLPQKSLAYQKPNSGLLPSHLGSFQFSKNITI